MTAEGAALSVRIIAGQLGLTEGIDFTIRLSRSEREFPVFVEGKGWQSAPMGKLSKTADMFADYLHDGKDASWQFADADRSGYYFTYKEDTTVRFA